MNPIVVLSRFHRVSSYVGGSFLLIYFEFPITHTRGRLTLIHLFRRCAWTFHHRSTCAENKSEIVIRMTMRVPETRP